MHRKGRLPQKSGCDCRSYRVRQYLDSSREYSALFVPIGLGRRGRTSSLTNFPPSVNGYWTAGQSSREWSFAAAQKWVDTVFYRLSAYRDPIMTKMIFGGCSVWQNPSGKVWRRGRRGIPRAVSACQDIHYLPLTFIPSVFLATG